MSESYKLKKLKGKDVFTFLSDNRGSIDDYFWEYYKNFTTKEIEDYTRNICSFAKFKGKLLSIGCGHGLNEIFIADMCKDVEIIEGLDIIEDKIHSMNAITDLLGFKNIIGMLGNGTKLEFPDQNYDFVIMIESLSHVSDQFLTLKEAVRVLKPDGQIFVLDFNNGANPRVLYKCWKENKFEGIEENPVNPYMVQNRLRYLGIPNITILPYKFTPFFTKYGNKLLPKTPIWFQLLWSRGFMLKGKK
ncbi:MAG: hypothetical protein A7315_06235 [Candidatus Altiarchaeales archaeon WOR_SM1_79]|nr:MAG: hypothetical protein A7315_06235 [Candidatus Altiarchaeales archaeon WOR_SM1_79]